MKVFKIDPLDRYHAERFPVAASQVAVYVMCGGGMLGNFAAEQPADFYIDDKVGWLPYPKSVIRETVRELVELARLNKLDPHNMPKMPGILHTWDD